MERCTIHLSPLVFSLEYGMRPTRKVQANGQRAQLTGKKPPRQYQLLSNLSRSNATNLVSLLALFCYSVVLMVILESVWLAGLRFLLLNYHWLSDIIEHLKNDFFPRACMKGACASPKVLCIFGFSIAIADNICSDLIG